MVSTNEFFQIVTLTCIVGSIFLWFCSGKITDWFISTHIKAPTRKIAQSIIDGDFLIDKQPQSDVTFGNEYVCTLIDNATGKETIVSLGYQGTGCDEAKVLAGDLDWMNQYEQEYIYDVVYMILKRAEDAETSENKRRKEEEDSKRRAEAMKRYQ